MLGVPGLTAENVRKYLPPSTATNKGHMHRTRKNLRSTRKFHQTKQNEDTNPPYEAQAVNEIFCFAALADSTQGTIYTDLPGKFPVRSFKGHRYIFLVYVYDINAILVRPMKSCKISSMEKHFQDIYIVI